MSRTSAPDAGPPELTGYRFVSHIGTGGNAQVYLYEQEFPSRKVAVKVLNESALSEAARRRFTAEANVTADLAHRHIVQVFEAKVTDDGRPYIVMPFYPQPNMTVRARRAHFTVTEVLRIGIQIGSAVETSHRRGVLHRDIKPQNILTDSYGDPALADFGIATTRPGDGPEGLSLPWSPPEIIDGTGPGDHRSDVYSLGATLWHLLVGRPPFEQPGGGNTTGEMVDRIISDQPPRTGRADVPNSLERLLRQTMAKDPAARPQSAMELIRGLQSIEQELRLPITYPILLADGPGRDDTRGSHTVARPAANAGGAPLSREVGAAVGDPVGQVAHSDRGTEEGGSGERATEDGQASDSAAATADPESAAGPTEETKWPAADGVTDERVPEDADSRTQPDEAAHSQTIMRTREGQAQPPAAEPPAAEAAMLEAAEPAWDQSAWIEDTQDTTIARAGRPAPSVQPAVAAQAQAAAAPADVARAAAAPDADAAPTRGRGPVILDPSGGGAATPSPGARPDAPPSTGRGRVLAFAGGAALLVVVAVVAVLALPRGSGSPSTTQTGASQTGTSQTGAGQSALGPNLGPPTVTSHRVNARQVEFNWTYANAARTDTFNVTVLSGGTGKPIGTLHKPDLTLTIPNGHSVCIMVTVSSANGNTSQSNPFCWPH